MGVIIYNEKNLYHGTSDKFSSIDTSECAGYKDFGKGIYTTNNKAQAQAWARKRKNNKKSIFILLLMIY